MTPLQCAGAPPPVPFTCARCTHRRDPRHSGASDAVRFLPLADQTGTAIAQNSPQPPSEKLHPAPFYTYVHLAAETARTLRRGCSKWRLNTCNNYGSDACGNEDRLPACYLITLIQSGSSASAGLRVRNYYRLVVSVLQRPPRVRNAAFTFILKCQSYSG